MEGMADEPSVTELIHRAERGDAEAADRLFAVMYHELRRLARARLRGGGRNTLLDTSSLVHESYLRFARAGRLQLQDRAHFMRWAGRVMRSVIVDFARRRRAERARRRHGRRHADDRHRWRVIRSVGDPSRARRARRNGRAGPAHGQHRGDAVPRRHDGIRDCRSDRRERTHRPSRLGESPAVSARGARARMAPRERVMDRDSWTQLNRLLDEALDLPPEDLESWLARLGPDDERSGASPRASRSPIVRSRLRLPRVASLPESSQPLPARITPTLDRSTRCRTTIPTARSSAPTGCCGASAQAAWVRSGWPSAPTACCSAKSP